MQSEKQWDLEIKSNSKLFEINVLEIWSYRDLIWLFVKRDFAAQYKQTVLGPLWHLIQPILTTIIFLLLFGRIAKLPTDGIHPVIFYMSGITVWNYFSLCLTSISSTFVANSSIFGKVYFPRIIMPLAVIFSNLIRFGIQMLLLVVVIFWYNFNGSPFTFQPYLFLLPVILALLAGIALGTGIIVSSLTTKYRDFKVLLTFAIQLGMYATPIVYPMSFLAGKNYAWLIELNPLTPIVEAFRFSLFGKGTFTTMDILYSSITTVVLLFLGLLLFNKVEKSFMDTV